MNKKADGGLTAVVIILIIIVFFGWLVNVGGRECRSNSECKEDYYCGSDFSCHKFPIIEKESVVIERNYTAPAIILSVALIITAIILKWDKFSLKFGSKKPKEDEPTHYNYPLYYTEHTKSK